MVIGEHEQKREWLPPYEGVNFQIPLQRIENFEGVSSVRRSLFDRQPKLHNYNRLSVVSNYTFPEILEDEDDENEDEICRGKTLEECRKVTRKNFSLQKNLIPLMTSSKLTSKWSCTILQVRETFGRFG